MCYSTVNLNLLGIDSSNARVLETNLKFANYVTPFMQQAKAYIC